MINQAVILVGGKGTRLGAITAQVPKPLLEIEPNKAFLDYLLLNIARHGLTKILLLAGHFGAQFYDKYNGKTLLNAKITVLIEPEAAGTAGALKYAEKQLEEQFFLINGDGYFDINYLLLESFFNRNNQHNCLALRKVEDASRYGQVELTGNKITAFKEKDASNTAPSLINGGIYILNKSILALIKKLPCSLEQEIFPQLVASQELIGLSFGNYFIDIGLPESLAQGRRELPELVKRPALFLDRDGTINKDDGYTHKIDDFEFIEGAAKAIAHANAKGHYVIVITNQAGIGRGYYSEKQMHAFNAHINAMLRSYAAHIDAFYFCPFHAEAKTKKYRHKNHPNRKPNAGLLLQAMQDWSIDVDKSLMVGDSSWDIEAAQKAGVKAVLYEKGSLCELVKLNLRAG